MPTSKKATTADAQIVLQLFDLRREAELRKARKWFGEFNPATAEDIIKIANAYGQQENTWFRQLLSYWDLAAALVLRGTVHPELFFDTNGELWFVYAKLRPFVSDVRKALNLPEFLLRLEKVATSTKEGRERVKKIETTLAAMRGRAASASARG